MLIQNIAVLIQKIFCLHNSHISENGIDVEAFKLLTAETRAELIPQIGPRLKFLAKWKIFTADFMVIGDSVKLPTNTVVANVSVETLEELDDAEVLSDDTASIIAISESEGEMISLSDVSFASSSSSNNAELVKLQHSRQYVCE